MATKEVQGLSKQDAKKLLAKYGHNELPDREKRNVAKVILGIITEPMIFLLLAAVTVYFVLGDTNEAIVLGISVVVVVALELYQDMKTERALAALRELSSPNCTVVRDGVRTTIASRELVVGDILVVSEGGRVAADCRLIEASNVVADESLLTGESIPVDKTNDSSSKSGVLYSGTMVVRGHGLAEVTATGVSTEIGKIGTSLNAIKPEKTLLQKEISKIVKVIAMFAVSACVLLALLFWLLRGDLLQGFLAGLTLAISTLPEEFPVVLTVFMARYPLRLV
jgi:Ca2+-transporting ATPase